MIIHNVTQGSPEWLALRTGHPTASEAPVMMGASSKIKRNELLHIKATGTEREISDWVQKNLFDKGHEYEALARPIVEEMIGEELYPATATDDDGYLLASFDGITMLEDAIFEHKMWNAELAEAVRQKDLPAEYYWQLEQQLYVSGAEKVIFVCSDGTRENFVWMEYRPVEGRRKALLDGWRQFEKDLASYVPEAPKVEPEGRAPEALPALRIEVTGMVTASNLAEFKSHAMAVLGGIKTELTTDSDFADAEKTVKWCKEAEERLEAAKQHALSQTASIDELFRTIDAIREETRAKRLELDKLVKSRKEAIRLEILQKAKSALDRHVGGLERRLEEFSTTPIRLPQITADFAGAMKGKKTLSSLQDAADTTLAKAKIEADNIAARIEANLNLLQELAGDSLHLFADLQQLVMREPDALAAIIKTRIAEYEAAEQKRLEAERERIRHEEQQKLEAEQRRKETAAAAAAKAELPPAAHQKPAPAARPQADNFLSRELKAWQKKHRVSADAMDDLAMILERHRVPAAA